MQIKEKMDEYYIKYPFDFNPMQEKVLPKVLFEEDNIVLSAQTSSGKTVVAECAIAKALLENKGSKVIYLSPLKSLTDEKLLDWQEMYLKKYRIESLTGDYILDAKKRKALEEADILLMTSEMLDSKTRSITENSFIRNVSLLVVDEVHLIHMADRGDKLESAIIRFSSIFPKSRIILLSATIPNVSDICEWLDKISNRNTIYIHSKYRPVKLNIHYSFYREKNKWLWKKNQETRRELTIDIIEEIPDDQQILIFVGDIAFGMDLVKELGKLNYESDFHYSGLNLSARRKLEARFKSKELRIMVSTTTTAWGINLPARNVILSHTTFGIEPMEIIEILQMCGRAGRPRYDTEGDVFIISADHKLPKKMDNPPDITSHLFENLRFHVLCEVLSGKIKDSGDFIEWYKETFAYQLSSYVDSYELKEMWDELFSMEMLITDKKGNFIVTPLGKVSVWMYFDPRDVSYWKDYLQEIDFEDDNYIAIMLGGIPSLSKEVANKRDKTEISPIFAEKKYIQAYFNQLNDISSKYIRKYQGIIARDLDRVIAALNLINSMVLKQDQYKPELKILRQRLKYSVPKHLVDLVSIDGVGKVFAKKLWDNGVGSMRDFNKPNNSEIIEGIVGKLRYKKIMRAIEEKDRGVLNMPF